MLVVDLTLPLTPDTPVIDGDMPIVITHTHSIERDGYQVMGICLGSHSGTHLDAPRHFFAEGDTLDRFPVERLVSPGWVLDVRPREAMVPLPPINLIASLSPGPVGQAPLESLPLIGAAATLAATAGPLGTAAPPHPVGRDQRVYELPPVDTTLLVDRLRETDVRPGDFVLLRTAGARLAEDAGQVLLDSGAGLVGTDAPGLDDEPYPVHRLLLGAGVLLAENLVNLDRLGPGRVMCAFLPLPVGEADGAPMRAVAWRDL